MEEVQMLEGEGGEAVARCMRLLVKLGEIYGADKMVKISSSQVSGVSYKSIGDPGLEFLRGFAAEGARVRVPTFLNPAGMDLQTPGAIGASEEFAKKQRWIIEAFREMGAIITCSCTPYLLGNLPRFGEHIAWGESSAVAFANSAIGARTNREGGPTALASAITGLTPMYGLHLEEKRRPKFLIDVDTELKSGADYGALGYFVGKYVKDGIPYFRGVDDGCSTDDLKALGAAMAASGAVAIFHVENMTPEAYMYRDDTQALERIAFSSEELKESYGELTNCSDPDLIVIGCPHSSISEIQHLAQKLEGRELKRELWVFTSRSVKVLADQMGYTKMVEGSGGRVVSDTCMVVSPMEELDFRCVGTDSGKAAKYIPGSCKKGVFFAGIDALIEKGLE
jgi:hypothetical protein